MDNLKVAVVDDEEMIRDFMVDAISESGTEHVLSFQNGEAAWDYLKGNDKLDILVSDIDMPFMNGLELLSRVKNSYPGIKCIMMSADPDKENEARNLGADVFLSKPFRLKTLLGLMKTFVEGCDPLVI